MIKNSVKQEYARQEGLPAIIEGIRELAEAKRELEQFKQENQDILKRKRELDKRKREAERMLRAETAWYVNSQNGVDENDPANDVLVSLPAGVDYNVSEQVTYDPQSVRAWCMRNAPYLLQVKFDAFEDMVKAHQIHERYKSRQVPIEIPARIVRTVLPVIADNLDVDLQEFFDENANVVIEQLKQKYDDKAVDAWLSKYEGDTYTFDIDIDDIDPIEF